MEIIPGHMLYSKKFFLKQFGGAEKNSIWGVGGTLMVGDCPPTKDTKKNSKGKRNSFICKEICHIFLHYSESNVFLKG